MYYSTKCLSPVGRLTIACDGERLVGLWMEGQKYYGGAISGEMQEKAGVPVLDAAKNWLERYFAGERPDVAELLLAPAGSEFRLEVWKILLRIPYGKVVTYGDIAKEMAGKLRKSHMSSQAVGGAVGHNPIAILIPCHRVVGANGSLTGYAAGIETKKRLLELEGINCGEANEK